MGPRLLGTEAATAGPGPGPAHTLPPTSDSQRTFHSYPTLSTCIKYVTVPLNR